MKKLVFICVMLLVAASVQALTVFTDCESMAGWTFRDDGQGTIGVVYDATYGGAYIDSDIWRQDPIDGVYTALGDANIAPGTNAADLPEMWMQFDVKLIGGENYWATEIELSSLVADNSYSETMVGLKCKGGSAMRATIWDGATGQGTETGNISYVGNATRVELHIYHVDSNTYMDVTTTGYDTEGIVSDANLVATLNLTGRTFTDGASIFGIKNMGGGNLKENHLYFDNLYFSNEGSYETVYGSDAPVASWVPVKECTSHTGDLDNDCMVTFTDFALLAARWMDCPYIPARLCN